MRREYEMTEEQLTQLLDACKPVPYMVMGGVEPSSPQENANSAWAALGREMGFDGMSVKPVSGKGQRFFTAEAVEAVEPEPEVSEPEQADVELPPEVPPMDPRWPADPTP